MRNWNFFYSSLLNFPWCCRVSWNWCEACWPVWWDRWTRLSALNIHKARETLCTPSSMWRRAGRWLVIRNGAICRSMLPLSISSSSPRWLHQVRKLWEFLTLGSITPLLKFNISVIFNNQTKFQPCRLSHNLFLHDLSKVEIKIHQSFSWNLQKIQILKFNARDLACKAMYPIDLLT